MESDSKAIWHVVRVQHDMSPFLSLVYSLLSSTHSSRTTTAMWQHINHTSFWLIDLDNPNLHRESSDLRVWIVLSVRVQNSPPLLLWGRCERVPANRGLYSHHPSIATSATDPYLKTQSVP